MRIIALLISGVCFSVSLFAQTTVNYGFEIAPDGVYLIERVEKTIEGSARKQVIETPVFLRDTAGVISYLDALKKRKSELDGQIKKETLERDFIQSKIGLLTGMADSLFFKPKIATKQ